jgi:DNA-binding transcriptional ArsR family regulator
MPLRTLQIAILGGSDEAVLVGLRNFPAHKLILIVSTGTKDQADQLARKLIDTLKLTVEIIQVKDESVQAMLDAVGAIVSRETDGFQDFLINVGSADKHLTCAGVTAAFVHGIRAFDVMGERLEVLPVMKFSYTQAVTEPKLAILRAIERSGGDVESLEKLSAIAKYGKPLLSYHIRGSPDSKGLEELGLVEVERGKRGRLRVKLTALGRTLLSTAPIKPSVSIP